MEVTCEGAGSGGPVHLRNWAGEPLLLLSVNREFGGGRRPFDFDKPYRRPCQKANIHPVIRFRTFC